jgi:hypothetical protein
MEKPNHKYAFTWPKHTGSIVITYGANSYLTNVAIEQVLPTEGIEEFLKLVPVIHDEKRLQEYIKWSQAKVSTSVTELTFEHFYEAFGNRKGKEEAQKAWKKLSEADQLKAYLYIPTYLRTMTNDRVAQLYPASYLNKKRWND